MHFHKKRFLALAALLAGCPEPSAAHNVDAANDASVDGRVTDAALDTTADDAPDTSLPLADSMPLDAASDSTSTDVSNDTIETSRCASVVCGPRACARATCDEATGQCVYTNDDSLSCDDGNACTESDRCEAGTCRGEDIFCARSTSACAANLCAAGTCSTATTTCTTATVTVRVQQNGAPLENVVVQTWIPNNNAFVPTGATGTTIWDGTIALTVPTGVATRFRAIVRGIPYDAAETCSAPACSSLTIEIPTSTNLRALTWDPFMNPEASGGERISRMNSFIERDGFYVEFWAVDGYRTPNAMLTTGHAHQGNVCYDQPGSCGNNSTSEEHHAFEAIQQGILVALANGGAFDLVSLDFRIRADSDPQHVNNIPGSDPNHVAIWVATDLTTSTLPTASFRARTVGTRAAMPRFETLTFDRVQNAHAVFLTSTWNVSFDNIVVRPR